HRTPYREHPRHLEKLGYVLSVVDLVEQRLLAGSTSMLAIKNELRFSCHASLLYLRRESSDRAAAEEMHNKGSSQLWSRSLVSPYEETLVAFGGDIVGDAYQLSASTSVNEAYARCGW